jgi:hypothetical protein
MSSEQLVSCAAAYWQCVCIALLANIDVCMHLYFFVNSSKCYCMYLLPMKKRQPFCFVVWHWSSIVLTVFPVWQTCGTWIRSMRCMRCSESSASSRAIQQKTHMKASNGCSSNAPANVPSGPMNDAGLAPGREKGMAV